MIDLPESVRRRGGIISTHELHAEGMTRNSIRQSLRAGVLFRVRQGWYALPGTHPLLFRAARVGGRLSCVSALAVRGCWATRDPLLHVAIENGSCRLREPGDMRSRLAEVDEPGVVTHWRRRPATPSRLLVDDADAARDLFACQPPLVVAAVLDSALRILPRLRIDWPELARAAPAQLRWTVEGIDGVCESGTESVFWQGARRWPCVIRRQVVIPGVGRVDFLLGRRLIVEVDGRGFHDGSEQFERDRRRDAQLSALGYRVLRFSYAQVFSRWLEVERAVLAAVARGDHL